MKPYKHDIKVSHTIPCTITDKEDWLGTNGCKKLHKAIAEYVQSNKDMWDLKKLWCRVNGVIYVRVFGIYADSEDKWDVSWWMTKRDGVWTAP